jgi:hypothetical protein
MRTFEYRLYPNRAQRRQLMGCLIESRALYNEMLESLKAQYEADGTFPTKYDLTARFKGRGGEVVPASTVQTLADRLSKALKRYLQLKDLGMPVGFPASRRPTAGIPFSCANTKRTAMSGWTRMGSTCTCPPSWGACSRSSCTVRLRAHR